jgi:hypothetical protein
MVVLGAKLILLEAMMLFHKNHHIVFKRLISDDVCSVRNNTFSHKGARLEKGFNQSRAPEGVPFKVSLILPKVHGAVAAETARLADLRRDFAIIS